MHLRPWADDLPREPPAPSMASFSLLSVLGNGSGWNASHPRYPVVAFQSGAALVLWDYARTGGESRQFLPLRPDVRLSALFFTRDVQSLLGLSLQGGQLGLSVWRTLRARVSVIAPPSWDPSDPARSDGAACGRCERRASSS